MDKTEKSAGAIILNKKRILLVYQTSTNTWAFPKGHIEENEELISTVKREVYEETGLTSIEIVKKLGKYTRSTKKSNNITKSITMFLAISAKVEVNPILEDVNKCVWISIDQVTKLLSYKEDQLFFESIKSDIECYY